MEIEEMVQRWKALATEMGERYGFSPAVVLAVIWIESRGNPNVINERSKATGLMQIMPREAGKVFASRPPQAELLDPETNVDWGCKILAWYYSIAQSLKTALYRYSGGSFWKSPEVYEQKYWKPFQEKRNEIEKLLGRQDDAQ